MKFTQTVAAMAVFALVNNVSAVQLKDIFDSYDIETKKEAANKDKEENVDPAALAKEINGEQIKAEVKSATADVSNQAMVQTDSKIRLGFIDDVEEIYVASEDVYLQRDITDKDGDGVEDNVKMSHHELDKFIKPYVYGDVEEMHNTRNGELPGHHLKNDHPEPTGDHASTIPDLRNVKSTAAEVVAEAKKNAPKEEKKEEKAAAPAAAEGEKKAEEKKEDKPAEEKKVQMNAVVREDDGSDLDTGDYYGLAQKPKKTKKGRIGNQPEKNADLDHDMLDRFDQEETFGNDIRDVFNTANGGLPGHWREGEDPAPEWHSSMLANGTQEPRQKRAPRGKAFMDNQASAVKDIVAEQDARFTSESFAVDLTNSARLAQYVVQIQGPQDLALFQNDVSLLQTGWCLGCNEIYDEDGDGVEDNRDLTAKQIDKFETPNVFNTAEEIYNTRNGELPGHIQKEFYDSQDEPTEVPSQIITGEWARS